MLPALQIWLLNVEGGGGLMRVTINLGQSDFFTLGDSPPVVVPASGAGKVNIILSAFFEYTFVSQPYASSPTSNERVTLGYVGTTAYDRGCPQVTVLTANEVGFLHYAFADIGAPDFQDFSLVENIAIEIKGHNLIAGVIETSRLGAGGAGYAPGDTGFLSGNSGDATYVVDTVSGGGAVASYHLDNGGTAYIVSNANPTQVSTGGGDGNFTIDILSVLKGDGTAKIVVDYITVVKP